MPRTSAIISEAKYSIGDMARKLRCSPSYIRKLEQLGFVPRKGKKGEHRFYTRQDFEKIRDTLIARAAGREAPRHLKRLSQLENEVCDVIKLLVDPEVMDDTTVGEDRMAQMEYEREHLRAPGEYTDTQFTFGKTSIRYKESFLRKRLHEERGPDGPFQDFRKVTRVLEEDLVKFRNELDVLIKDADNLKLKVGGDVKRIRRLRDLAR